MRLRTRTILLATALVAGVFTPAAAHEGTHSENIRHVANFGYEMRNDNNGQGQPNYGTDIEFTTLTFSPSEAAQRFGPPPVADLDGDITNGVQREYALAGSYRNGLQIFDITNPENTTLTGVYDCGVTQGDVQVFKRDGRTYVTYTSDTYGDGTSTCYREAQALGLAKPERTVTSLTGTQSTRGENGTFIADITDPGNPVTVSFVAVPQGSHNQTVHPSGDYLYNSNSDLITSAMPAIEVFDIRDFSAPQLVTELALPTRPGLGTESHDITFNSEGTRAYSAALSQTVIINTEDPAKPEVVSSFVDPAINVEHQADPFSLGGRDFVIVEDEYVGAAGGPHCPSGGVHIYETTGDLEENPRKVGYWNIDDFRATPKATGRCTAHVFDIHEDEAIMTIAFYNGGVRVVDIGGLVGVGLGTSTTVAGSPMRELAHYYFDDSDTWSAKTPRIEADGSFYLYGNDVARGLDIFHYDPAAGPASADGGEWMSPAEAAVALGGISMPADYTPFCLLPQT